MIKCVNFEGELTNSGLKIGTRDGLVARKKPGEFERGDYMC